MGTVVHPHIPRVPNEKKTLPECERKTLPERERKTLPGCERPLKVGTRMRYGRWQRAKAGLSQHQQNQQEIYVSIYIDI